MSGNTWTCEEIWSVIYIRHKITEIKQYLKQQTICKICKNVNQQLRHRVRRKRNREKFRFINYRFQNKTEFS